MIFTKYDSSSSITETEKKEIIEFLHAHLEQYRDSERDIEKAIDYALKISDSFGGFIIKLVENSEIIGATVVNKTGMDGYIPENILVYIAIHNSFRGKGVGKKLMEEAIAISDGDIALHVE
ncbi:GNAT family N-acetyltransferase, partial [bacterium]|nr:GNAT family N-acetyltransferase [bacterium]